VGELRTNLANRIRAAAIARLRLSPSTMAPSAIPAARAIARSNSRPGSIIAIGASTGGTEALHELLIRMPADSPGMLITQHIPPIFSLAFAKRLNQVCSFEVKEAVDGDSVSPGRALIAPGNLHMLLRKSNDGYRVQVKDGPQVCYQRPSVDVMFASVAEAAGAHAVGVILTGMGSDGANGLLRMKRAGAHTIAQDEASCVVFGMPKEAIRLGAADRVLPLFQIPEAILNS
jgi:two-component system chemotaxis response regulator CheB